MDTTGCLSLLGSTGGYAVASEEGWLFVLTRTSLGGTVGGWGRDGSIGRSDRGASCPPRSTGPGRPGRGFDGKDSGRPAVARFLQANGSASTQGQIKLHGCPGDEGTSRWPAANVGRLAVRLATGSTAYVSAPFRSRPSPLLPLLNIKTTLGTICHRTWRTGCYWAFARGKPGAFGRV